LATSGQSQQEIFEDKLAFALRKGAARKRALSGGLNSVVALSNGTIDDPNLIEGQDPKPNRLEGKARSAAAAKEGRARWEQAAARRIIPKSNNCVFGFNNWANPLSTLRRCISF